MDRLHPAVLLLICMTLSPLVCVAGDTGGMGMDGGADGGTPKQASKAMQELIHEHHVNALPLVYSITEAIRPVPDRTPDDLAKLTWMLVRVGRTAETKCEPILREGGYRFADFLVWRAFRHFTNAWAICYSGWYMSEQRPAHLADLSEETRAKAADELKACTELMQAASPVFAHLAGPIGGWRIDYSTVSGREMLVGEVDVPMWWSPEELSPDN